MAYVYVITNDLFPGLSKIGSAKDVSVLLDRLTEAIPGKSHIVWQYLVEDAAAVASTVHGFLSKLMVPYSPGWYSCPADLAIKQFQLCMAQSDPYNILDNLWVEDKKHIRSVADLGDFCHTWRLQIGMSQQDLADHADLSLQFIVDFEAGQPWCSMDGCLRVAELLGIDLFAAKR